MLKERVVEKQEEENRLHGQKHRTPCPPSSKSGAMVLSHEWQDEGISYLLQTHMTEALFSAGAVKRSRTLFFHLIPTCRMEVLPQVQQIENIQC